MRNKIYHFSYSSVFAKDINEYVELKQAMGLWFRTPAENLHRFDRLCIELDIQAAMLTEELISAWIAPRPDESERIRQFSEFQRGANKVALRTAEMVSSGPICSIHFHS